MHLKACLLAFGLSNRTNVMRSRKRMQKNMPFSKQLQADKKNLNKKIAQNKVKAPKTMYQKPYQLLNFILSILYFHLWQRARYTMKASESKTHTHTCTQHWNAVFDCRAATILDAARQLNAASRAIIKVTCHKQIKAKEQTLSWKVKYKIVGRKKGRSPCIAQMYLLQTATAHKRTTHVLAPLPTYLAKKR